MGAVSNLENSSIGLSANSERSAWFIIIPLLIALFFPTSINGVINPYLSLIGNTIALLIFCTGIIVGSLKVSLTLFTIALSFMLMLFVMTILSPFNQITLGAIVPYATFSIICSTKIKDVFTTKLQRFVLIITVLLILVCCFLIVLDYQPLIALQESYYQMFPNLFDFMMNWARKPVLMFATHSVAGFAYFIISLTLFLFFLVAESFFAKFLLLLGSVSYSVFLILLLSNTGFILFLIMLLVYLSAMCRTFGMVAWFFTFLIFVTFIVTYADLIIDVFTFAWDSVVTILSSKDNGLIARFTLDSRPAASYEYVFNSPLIGVGFTEHSSLAFGDNLLAEYVLRAGLFGYILVMLLVFGFFYSNVKIKSIAIFLFMFVLISDLGYPLFVAFRFVFIFPLIILLSNYYFSLKEVRNRDAR